MAEHGLEVVNDLGLMSKTEVWAEHRRVVVQGDDELVLLIKLRSADAKALAATLANVNALSMAPSEAGVIVRAWADARELGVVTVLPEIEGDVTRFAVSRGGARRTRYWSHEVMLSEPVTIRVPQGEGNAAAGWPEPSAALLRFVAPLKPEDMPLRMAEEVLRMASTVWRGVVLADQENRPQALTEAKQEVTERGAPEGLVELLVDRKRRNFSHDVRLLSVEEVAKSDGEVQVTVRATVSKN